MLYLKSKCKRYKTKQKPVMCLCCAQVAQYIGEMCRYLVSAPPRDTDAQHRVRILVGNGMRPAIWQEVVDR